MFDLPKGRISGRALRALAAAVRSTPAKHLAAQVLRRDLGITALRALPFSERSSLPVDVRPLQARPDHDRASMNLGLPAIEGGWPRSAASIRAAYRGDRTTPVAVVEKALAAARDFATRRPSACAFVAFDDDRALRAAKDAEARLRAGSDLGPLDGVPIAVKEEVDVEGLPTRLGTGFLPSVPAARDCVAVARLRAKGAVILGLTSMTEYGMSPLGGNTFRVMPRNAHDGARLAGGSSTGSGVAVAQGNVPVALGVDGGGSIRTPAAFNGVFGLKPSYGRIPLTGHGQGTGSTVTHLGPIGATAHDLALFMEATAGEDSGDGSSAWQPGLGANELGHALARGVKGLRIGVIESEWQDADSALAALCRSALGALEKEGAVLVRVTLPLVREAAPIGYLTIGLESYSGLADVRREHMHELGLDNQLLLAGLATFEPDDYLDAQRLRATLRRNTATLLTDVDVIALPSAKSIAPSVTDEEASQGFIDPVALDAACRFAFLANVTGLPAGTAPVGRADGLPVGLQIIGDAWDEACVLQVLAHLERVGAARVERPATFVDLLA